MAAGDVAKLVRDHALQLVDIVGRDDQAGLDIDHLARRDEGVDLVVLEQDDLDAAGVEPGRLDQRLRHVAEQQFSLAVAQDLRAVVPLRGRRLDDRESKQQRHHEQAREAGQRRRSSRAH